MRSNSDEKYVLELVAEVLNENYEWQKRFDTLLGDPGKNGRRSRLSVDAYFSNVNLIIEYREKQHSQSVRIMDKRMTVSGVDRGEQRRIYDLWKEKWAKDNDIMFLAIDFSELSHKKSGKLLKNIEEDRKAISKMMNEMLGR